MNDSTHMNENSRQLKDTREMLDNMSRSFDSLPDPIRKRVEGELKKLKEMVLEQRPPRILIIGRRGSGKSSLINAIFKTKVAKISSVLAGTGRGTWYTYASPRGELKILDTRGFGDSDRPDSAEQARAEDEIAVAIQAEAPDAILFLCKAKEADARITEDIRSLLEVHRKIVALHDYQCPIIGLVTQVDELDPLRIGPPFDHEEKRKNIETACQALHRAFAEAGQSPEKIFPIATYMEFENGEIVDSRIWNVETLLEYLIKVLPLSAQLVMARTARVRAAQRRLANDVVTASTAVASAIAAVPIPLADTIPLTALQLAMITAIGFLAGRSMTKQTAAEFASAMGLNLGAGLAFRELARGLIKLIPGAGSLISAAVAGAGTWAVGQAAIHYFIEGKTAAEAKGLFESVKAEKQLSNQ